MTPLEFIIPGPVVGVLMTFIVYGLVVWIIKRED